jgi:HTH-like domain
MVGRQALEIELLKGGFETCSPAEKRDPSPSSPAPRHLRPKRVRADGPRTIHLLRHAARSLDGDELLARIGAICDEFECYGYRRVGAAPRHQGVLVNSKKLRRIKGKCSRT